MDAPQLDQNAMAAKLRLYETVLQATPDLTYVFDRQHRFIYANQALLNMWGMRWEEAAYKTCLEIGYEPWHAAMHDEEIERVIATRQPIRGEVPFPHVTLGVRIYDYIFSPVFGPDGEVEAIAGSTRDITQRKQHEQHMQLLINELNHRVKNTLATVQSMTLHTLRNSADVADAQDKMEARLMALSDAHDILTRESWQGAELAEVARVAAAPHQITDGDRFDISGPVFMLDPRRAVALSMALHELCTNAAKYGALSVPAGRVRIHWDWLGEEEAGLLDLRWEEYDGPAVRPPERHGFGTRLVERGLKYDLGGESVLDYAPEGVTCRITMPAPKSVAQESA
ncbi:HWE histidine kinase domain-containing protein [Stenotrophomonas sp. HITSZ_GD]|uniref:sensor histidine kinase n=1 Tax=Stenotrophomonas sp. HITSZ_GD TaxID=3037248 RepID=UPI00240DA24C|nr:HWE histidine kinase domain-containing protein [Stenotrophomonas sp. HITSZ_GD]MDG2525853.1 HWE histidine kinase domain-containing protein [Stenotrophomonas sp. HITSZ_GD]